MPRAHAEVDHTQRRVPDRVRRLVAVKYGCPPGSSISVPCHYCHRPDHITWFRKPDGRPSFWVHFGHHLHHVWPWSRGGQHTVENLVLACADCNLSRGAKI